MPQSIDLHDPYDLVAHFPGLPGEFIAWFEHIKGKRAFKQVKSALDRSLGVAAKIYDSSDRKGIPFPDLMLLQIFRACWSATLYEKMDDPSKAAKRIIKERLGAQEKWAADLRLVLNDWTENDQVAGAFHYAKELAKKKKLIGPDEAAAGPKQWWNDLFQILIDCFEGKHLKMLPPLFQQIEGEQKGGMFSHNTNVGCLAYPEGNIPQNAPTIQKQLAFKLVFHLREFTLPVDQRPAFGACRWMPKGGAPNYQAAARLLEMTFPDVLVTTENHNKRIERSVTNLVSNGVLLIPFPDIN